MADKRGVTAWRVECPQGLPQRSEQHHKAFAARIEGMPPVRTAGWHASVLLNRLMFIYFIQQKRFPDYDQNYLRNRLRMIRERYGPDQFYVFYKQLIRPL